MLKVSNYHYIRKQFNSKYPSIFGVTPEGFKRQLLQFKNQGEFVHPTQFLDDFENILKTKENIFLITFDDGLKEQFDLALPILDELNIPALFFVNSINFEEKRVSTVHKIHLLRSIIPSKIFLSELQELDDFGLKKDEIVRANAIYKYDDAEGASLKYFLNFKLTYVQQEKFINKFFDLHFEENSILNSLYMNKKNLKELAERGFLGSHSHSHYPLGLLRDNELHFELNNSKTYLEQLTNSATDFISYPYGTPEACTDKVAKMAKSLGYKIGFTTTRGINTLEENYLLLNRYDCNDLIGGKNYK